MPGLSPPKPSPHWIDVAGRATLAARGWMEVEAGPEAILLYDIDGQVFATAAICPHHAAWLSQGGIDRGPGGPYVDCPRHQGRFVIATGEQVRGPACGALRTFAIRIEDGRVHVAPAQPPC